MANSRGTVQANHFGLSKHQRALVRNAALNIETNLKFLLLQYMLPEYSREFLYQMSTIVNFYALSKLPMVTAIEYVRIANRFEDFLFDWSGCDDSVELLNDDFDYCLSTLRYLKDLYTGSAYPIEMSEIEYSVPASYEDLRELIGHVMLDDDQRFMIDVELRRLAELRPNGALLMNYYGA